jgi:hypothetical protein
LLPDGDLGEQCGASRRPAPEEIPASLPISGIVRIFLANVVLGQRFVVESGGFCRSQRLAEIIGNIAVHDRQYCHKHVPYCQIQSMD